MAAPLLPAAGFLPRPAPRAPAARRMRAWKVVHAAEDPGHALSLAEAQAESGMIPSILTSRGRLRPGTPIVPPPPPVSLLRQWRAVRRWRALLQAENSACGADLLHAHCFTAAVAGLSANITTVYDFAAECGAAAGPWLLRSLRAAENFALARAAAVVVHSHGMWDRALRRGVAPDDLFLVPDPLVLPPLRADAPPRAGRVTFFAPGVSDAPSAEMLLRAFSTAAGENAGADLLLETPAAFFSDLAGRAAALQIAQCVRRVAPGERDDTLSSADVVIVGDAALATLALARGRALLAADVPAIREVTPHGRGCLWYRPACDRDLAFRASFLARNPDLRAALGRAGRAHLEATRGPEAVAQACDEAYRHAASRRGRGAAPPAFPGAAALQLV
jgi:glycosyltransferase involved in cell wall biosynthesis